MIDVERARRIVLTAERAERDKLLADVARLTAQVNELTLLVFDLLDQTGYKTRPVKLIRAVQRR